MDNGNKIGITINDLLVSDVSPKEVAELAIWSAIEIDNYLIGQNDEFTSVKKLADIFEEYQLSDKKNYNTESGFHYFPLSKAINYNSKKRIKLYSELALEMKLINSELKKVPHSSPENLKELRELLCNISKEYSSWQEELNQPTRRNYSFI